MATSCDLVIVGGGPAGISTALHLQQYAPALAARTIVVEKSVYPRDKYCAGAVAARGLRRLDRLGVRVEVPQVSIDALSLRVGGGDVVIREPGLGVVLRRIEFDHALARAAMTRGIDLRQGSVVTGIETDARGVRVHILGQPTLQARAVVGADGVGGIVRRAAGLSRGRLRAQAIEVDTETTPGDPPHDALHFDFRFAGLNGYAWDFPTLVGGERRVCRGVYLITDRAHKPARAWLERYLDERGLHLGAYRLKQYAERGFDLGAPISRPRVMLVGEAAGIDIATGEGIAQALAFGELAARALSGAFRDGEFGFGDWLHQVLSEGIGKRMHLRQLAYRVFFGPDRQVIEKLTRESPRLLQVAARDFAGKPWGTSETTRGLAALAPKLALHPGVLQRSWRAAMSRAESES